MKQRFYRILTSGLCLLLSAFSFDVTSAQTTSSTTRWTGTDVSTLTPTTNGSTSENTFFLYNVGTGRFLVASGTWGTEGMVLYQDYGAQMKLKKETDGRLVILSGVTTNSGGTDAYCFGVNYPGMTNTATLNKFDTGNKYFSPIMNAGSSASVNGGTYTRSMNFIRVEEESNTSTYTYELEETIVNGSNTLKAWIGAVNGRSPNSSTAATFVGKNNSTFYVESMTSGSSVNKQYTVNADSLNYLWRLVTPSQIKEALFTTDASAYGGLNININYLLSDPAFDYDRTEFSNWTVTSGSSTTETNIYRYDWTKPSNIVSKYSAVTKVDNDHSTTPWDAAVFRKLQLGTADEGKYTFAEFEGVGTATQTFTAPAEGNYVISLTGFYTGNNPVYLTASNRSTTNSTALPQAQETYIKCTQATNGTVTVNPHTDWLAIGQELASEDGLNNYRTSVVVSAKEGETITIGLKKDAATQSAAFTSGSNTYYYDTDFAAVDNISIYYVKSDPLILDEEATSTQYIKDFVSQNPTSSDGNTVNNADILLKRTFSVGKWNSLILPVDVTMAQLQSAFGSDVQLAKLEGVGAIDGLNTCINFRLVPITADGTAITAGELYLIKPALKPVALSYTTSGGDSQSGSFYQLGRADVSSSKVSSKENDLVTTAYKSAKTGITVNCTGTYTNNAGGCPADAYVFSGGTMYQLESALDIKGFRSYITNTDASGAARPLTFNIAECGVPVGIDIPTIQNNSRTKNVVYTIDGIPVRLGDEGLEGLQHGIYIVNGKKVLK